jgi:hypothetical protein
VVSPWEKIVQPKLAAIFGGGPAARRRIERLEEDGGRRDASAAGILHGAPQKTSRILRLRNDC